MGISLNGNDGNKVQGFIEIELISKEGVSRTIRQNTVTNVGKLAMLARSGNEMMMGFGGTPYGRLSSVDMLGSYSAQSYVGLKKFTKQDDGLNNYLVNLPAEVTLTADSKFLPVFDNNFNVDATKLIGFANSRDVTADTREGIQDFSKAAYMLDGTCIANRWKYAEGFATGTFNHLIMAPGIHGGLKCNGMYVKKCITRINQFEDTAVFGNMFIIPGATGLTTSTKILLNYNRNGVSRWYYDLSTGESTAVPNTDIGYSMTMYDSWDQVFVNGFLYVLDTGGVLRKINCTTGATDASLSLGGQYTHGGSLYYDGTDLIAMSSYDSPDGSNDWYANVNTVNLTSFTTASVYKTAWTVWGGIPTGWQKNRMIVRKVGSYYYVNNGYNVIKCTDLTNIKGTVVGSYLAHPKTMYASDGTATWMIEVGSNEIDYTSIESTITSVTQNTYSYRVMDNGTERIYSNYNNGIYVSKEDAGNILSFVKLTTPITKAATDIMYVSYGYKFV